MRKPLVLFLGGVIAACTGSSGSNGADGESTLVSVSTEAAGSNCVNGGQRIDTGVDTNGNGTLDSDEVTSSSYVCNGGTGGTGSAGNDGDQALVAVSTEPAGAHCADGGQRIDVGIDDNGNGTLDAGEIDSTQYVCNGGDSLLALTNEPAGTHCLAGGQRIDTGIDDDGDGTLEASEIDHTAYVCNVSAGYVYLANWAGFNSGFDEYDIAANTWRSAAPLPSPSRGQITTAGLGVVMIGVDGNVYAYSHATDSWTADGMAPALSSFSFLRALDDNLYACENSTQTMYVRHGGVWSTIALPQPCSVAGGVDAAAHEVYVKTNSSAGFTVIDTLTNTVVRSLADSTPIAENTSSAATLAGQFYTRSASGPIYKRDGTTGALTNTGTDPGGTYAGFAAEPQSGIVYAKGATTFTAYRPATNAVTTLSAGPNQSTLSAITVVR